MILLFYILLQTYRQTGTNPTSTAPVVATGLTALQQWEVLLAVVLLISLAGGGVYKIWKELSKYTSSEAEKTRLWQSTQDAQRHQWQNDRDTAFNKAQDERDEKWRAYFSHLQELAIGNQDDLKDALIAITTNLLKMNDNISKVNEAILVHHEWAKTTANNPISPGRRSKLDSKL